MGSWLLRSLSKKANPEPTPTLTPKPSRTPSFAPSFTSSQEQDQPHSPICNKFCSLGGKETGYIDEVKLRAALRKLFDKDNNLNLEYGLSTRAERWTFWAPKEVKWDHIKVYMDE